MPRFSANLGFLWAHLPLLERIERAAQAGFKAIEMHWPYDTPAADLRAACERLGLTVLGLNTVRGDVAKGENGLGALPGREGEFQAAIDQSLAYCRESGAQSIHAMAGFVPATDHALAHEVFVDNLREATLKADQFGITLLLEPLNPRDAPGYFYSTVGAAAAIVEEIGANNLKLMFDVYHVGVTEGDVIMKLRQHQNIIGHVQIAAVPSRAEPDEGEISFPAIFSELEALGYDGWVGCEYQPRASVEDGLAWVKKLGLAL